MISSFAERFFLWRKIKVNPTLSEVTLERELAALQSSLERLQTVLAKLEESLSEDGTAYKQES